MRTKKSKRLYTVVLEFGAGITRTVQIRATTREIAEHRALKFNPTAQRIKHDVH